MHKDFKIILSLTKGYKSDDGRLFVEGIASGTDLDLTGERMSPEAIKSMAESLNKGLIEFRSEHSSDWDSQFGQISELTVTPDNQLHYKAELDPGFSKSHDLLHALAKGKKLGVSIGGQVVKAGMEWVEELQRSVYTYFDIVLKEISVTAQPAYAQAWVSNIAKSINRQEIEVSMPETQKNTEVTVEEVTVTETVIEVETTVEETPASDTAEQEVATPTEVVAEVTAEAPAEVATDQPAAEATADEPAVEETAPEVAAESTENVAAEPAATEEAATPEVASDPTEAPVSEDKPLAETQKAQYLSEWAEADASAAVICNLSDDLSWRVWACISDDEMDPAAQTQMVDAMLTEFHAIVMRVATALIAQDAQSDAAEMAKALQAKRTELHKSLDEKLTELDAVVKALAEKTEQVTERETQIAALNETVTEKDAALTSAKTEAEIAQKALAKAGAKAEIEEARKAYQVTSKFDLAVNLQKQPDEKDMQRQFASLFAGNK